MFQSVDHSKLKLKVPTAPEKEAQQAEPIEEVSKTVVTEEVVTEQIEPTPTVEEPEGDDVTIKRGKLPEGFPGKASLDKAGFGTYAKVRKLIEDGTLLDVPGIGEPTAAKIKEAFEG